MPFEQINERVDVVAEILPVSLCLRGRKAGKPVAQVRFRMSFTAEHGITTSARFDAFVGIGEDAGRIRLRLNKKGVFAAKPSMNGSIVVDLGHLAALGGTPRAAEGAAVSKIGDDFEIIVPDWKEQAPAKPKAKLPAVVEPGDFPKFGGGHVLFRGASKEVASKVGKLVEPLIKHFGKPVKKSDLIKLAMGGVGNDVSLGTLVTTANGQISSLGLAIRNVRVNGTAGCQLIATADEVRA